MPMSLPKNDLYLASMTMETALTWSWLNILTKKRYDALQSVYGDLGEALQHLDEELLQGLGCKQETIYKVLNRLEEFDVSAYQSVLAKRGIQMLSIEDVQYPASLRKIEDPPVFLYYQGDPTILAQPCMAIVGTRTMSDYGKRVTESIVQACVQANVVTVSGLATGIDTVVAQESVRANSPTVAVLGHGMANISPVANKKLAEQIVEKGGLVLSEFPLDQAGDTYTFPARNRIVAGLSLATIVTEAPEGSGALITADLASGYGRDVFAVPGQIFDTNYGGCHRILRSGQAKLAADPQVILKDIGIVASVATKQTTYTPNTPLESAIWQALTSMPQGLDEIMEKSGLKAGEINATLTILELQGAAQNVGKNQWVRA